MNLHMYINLQVLAPPLEPKERPGAAALGRVNATPQPAGERAQLAHLERLVGRQQQAGPGGVDSRKDQFGRGWEEERLERGGAGEQVLGLPELYCVGRAGENSRGIGRVVELRTKTTRE